MFLTGRSPFLFGQMPRLAKGCRRPHTLARPGELRTIVNVARLDALADSAACGNSQVVVVLKIHPELCRQAKIPFEANSSIGTDGPIPADDVIDARKVERLSQRISAQAHRFHELGLENLSRMHRKDLSL